MTECKVRAAALNSITTHISPCTSWQKLAPPPVPIPCEKLLKNCAGMPPHTHARTHKQGQVSKCASAGKAGCSSAR
eukprot:1160055-Pelagomonas_calceolata.AAC.2